MFTHPAITEALASQHRRDLLSQADAYRLARAARGGRLLRPGLARMGRRPAGLTRQAKRAVTAAAAVFAAAAVMAAAPAGTRWAAPHASAGHFWTPQSSHWTAQASHWTAQSSHWTPQASHWV